MATQDVSSKRSADHLSQSEDEPEPVKHRVSRLEKVISGGQDGADIAGLRAAKKVGLQTGGYMTEDFMTISGPKPEYAQEYGMKALKAGKDKRLFAQYRARTCHNVQNSDGTIIFDFSEHGSVGTTVAKGAARKQNKSFMVLKDLNNPEFVVDFIKEFDIRKLNVAGNRDADSDAVCDFLVKAFELVLDVPKTKSANKT